MRRKNVGMHGKGMCQKKLDVRLLECFVIDEGPSKLNAFNIHFASRR